MHRIFPVLLVVAYPAMVYLGMDRFGPGALAVLLGVLMSLRLLTTRRGNGRLTVPLLVLVAIFVLAVWMSADDRLLRAYPVLISLGLLSVFAGSLWRPPSFVERIARLQKMEVPDEAVPYLRWVTIGWCVFFVFNAAVAAWTAWFASLEIWTLYNGLISYILIALLFAIEYGIRKIYQRRFQSQGPDRE